MTLTDAQLERLDALEPGARVIGTTDGTARGNPVVRRPSGTVSAVNPWGRLVPPPSEFRPPRRSA